MLTRDARLLATLTLWSVAALAAATETWVLDLKDWSCDSYDVVQEGLTLESCTTACGGYTYVAHWWGGDNEGRCGCGDHCGAGDALDSSVNEHNIVLRSGAVRSTHVDTWGIFRKDWDCNTNVESESTGLDLQECLSFCGDAGYSHTQHWSSGTSQGLCRCGVACDERTGFETDTASGDHNAVYKAAASIGDTKAFVMENMRCDITDNTNEKMGLESCIEHCSGYVGMYHYENSHYKCRCTNDCSEGRLQSDTYASKAYRTIPLQRTWVEWKESHECKRRHYNLQNYAPRLDLASCMAFCEGYSFLLHRSYGSSGRCQCLSSCDSPTAVSARSTESVKVYRAVPIQMLYAIG